MSGKNPLPQVLAYDGVKAPTPANLLTGKADPTTAAARKQDLGTWFLNKVSGALFYLSAPSTWTNISGGAGNFSSINVTGSGTFGTGVTTTTGNLTATNGNLSLGTAGNKIQIATGTNASLGTSVAMTAGTVTISTTAVTASSIIFLTANTPGGIPGILSAPAASRVAGTSFVINSSSNTDTSTVNWWIVN